MSLHDAYARLTPFEAAFPDRSRLEALSTDVAAESESSGWDDTVPEAFVTSAAVGELARTLRASDSAPESAYPFAALLYHGVHFVRAGCPIFLVDTAATRRLTRPGFEGASADPAAVEPPARAGYLQLPRHLVWTAGTAAPESVDGVFWTVSHDGALHALPISGLLPDRPGFSAHPVPGAPLSEAKTWTEASARASGEDFASQLPGGELDDLLAVETAGEVLKLLARFFAVARGAGVRLESCPGAATPSGGKDDRGDPGAPRPSVLPYTRVSLDG
jgi:hypothetical protein